MVEWWNEGRLEWWKNGMVETYCDGPRGGTVETVACPCICLGFPITPSFHYSASLFAFDQDPKGLVFGTEVKLATGHLDRFA